MIINEYILYIYLIHGLNIYIYLSIINIIIIIIIALS